MSNTNCIAVHRRGWFAGGTHEIWSDFRESSVAVDSLTTLINEAGLDQCERKPCSLIVIQYHYVMQLL